MNAPLTPSQQRGILVTPRLPDFDFDDDTVDAWLAGDPGMTGFWNAVSVLAGHAEGAFIQTGRWLVAHLDDPAQVDETRRFVQQEAFHSVAHKRFNKALAAQGLPVAGLEALGAAVMADLQETCPPVTELGFALGTEQFIGEFGHALLAQDDPMADAPAAARRLFLWHCYEEVEHQAALHDGFDAVFGASPRVRGHRVLGIGFALAMFVPTLAVGTWVFACRSAGGRRLGWRALGAVLLGEAGLLRGLPSVFRAMTRVDFHPFDVHDPGPMLAAHADCVDPAWEKPIRGRWPAAEGDPVDVPPVGVVAMVDLLGFAARTVRRSLAFAWAHRDPAAA